MLSNQPIPTWVYEPLPYAYGFAGSISTYQLDHSLGQIAGVILIAAGLLVWSMRRQYRRSQKLAARRRYQARSAPIDGIQLRHYRD
jgi:hypothetical protein